MPKDTKGHGSNAKSSGLTSHPMHSASDLAYLRGKGYSDNEIKTIWDRDHKGGASPVVHKKAPDVVGVVANPNHYKKGSAGADPTPAKPINKRGDTFKPKGAARR